MTPMFKRTVKKIRGSSKCCSSSVDGLSCSEDIANLFAEKYQELYTSVSYEINDMTTICEELHSSTVAVGFDSNSTVSVHEVMNAIHRLKTGKSEGCIGLSSNYFLNACDELFVRISLLFSGLCVHGCIPEIMSLSTIIPIPKGKHANVTESVSYRGIALILIFGKILDLVLLLRHNEGLMSCDLQFGFKARRSTDMCTM